MTFEQYLETKDAFIEDDFDKDHDLYMREDIISIYEEYQKHLKEGEDSE